MLMYEEVHPCIIKHVFRSIVFMNAYISTICVIQAHCYLHIIQIKPDNNRFQIKCVVRGIDHDTVCAGVVGTAIRNSTSCAGRRAAASGRAGRHNECCSGLQYQPRQRRPYKWSISILPRSQFTKSKGNLRFRRLVPCSSPSAFA